MKLYWKGSEGSRKKERMKGKKDPCRGRLEECGPGQRLKVDR